MKNYELRLQSNYTLRNKYDMEKYLKINEDVTQKPLSYCKKRRYIFHAVTKKVEHYSIISLLMCELNNYYVFRSFMHLYLTMNVTKYITNAFHIKFY